MKNKQALSGFTLIELLVVVLIIGILAAVALPQYQIAVEKSRATEHIVNVRAWVEAIKRYQIINGDYPAGLTSALQDIDIELPVSSKASPVYYRGPGTIYAGYASPAYLISFSFKGLGDGKGMTCVSRGVNQTDDFGARVCKSLCSNKQLTQIYNTMYGCSL